MSISGSYPINPPLLLECPLQLSSFVMSFMWYIAVDPFIPLLLPPPPPLPSCSEHGVSRSVTVVLAYLMWSECLSLKLLYQELKEKKPDIR